jgi:hypothetical protein
MSIQLGMVKWWDTTPLTPMLAIDSRPPIGYTTPRHIKPDQYKKLNNYSLWLNYQVFHFSSLLKSIWRQFVRID